MTDQAKIVIDAYERLTPDEQIEAYLAIEELWKRQQNNGTASNAPTHSADE